MQKERCALPGDESERQQAAGSNRRRMILQKVSLTLTSSKAFQRSGHGIAGSLMHRTCNSQLFFDAVIDPAALRESDLLAFEIGIERGHAGALMCAYNEVNGVYACGSETILDGVVKQALGYMTVSSLSGFKVCESPLVQNVTAT
jgi:hypothetical protein